MNEQAQPPRPGDVVVVHYRGAIRDGETFYSSWGHGPLVFEIGTGHVKPFFEKAVREMTPGTKRTIEVSPEEGYGPYRPELVASLPRETFPPGEPLEVGRVIRLESTDGWFQAEIVALDDETVTIDPNHPLTGKHLVYEIDLLEIERRGGGDASGPAPGAGEGAGEPGAEGGDAA